MRRTAFQPLIAEAAAEHAPAFRPRANAIVPQPSFFRWVRQVAPPARETADQEVSGRLPDVPMAAAQAMPAPQPPVRATDGPAEAGSMCRDLGPEDLLLCQNGRQEGPWSGPWAGPRAQAEEEEEPGPWPKAPRPWALGLLYLSLRLAKKVVGWALCLVLGPRPLGRTPS